MNWCGAKNRVQPRDKERKKMKLFFEKCKQEKLKLSRKSTDAVLSKDIGHLACVSNVHYKQKPEPRSQTKSKNPNKSKTFNSLGAPFKKKNKFETLDRSQVEFDCNRIKRVFIPPSQINSFPESKLEFDDGVYDTVNTNQTNESSSQMHQESYIQQQQQQTDIVQQHNNIQQYTVQQHTDVERNNNIQQYTVQQHTDVERNNNIQQYTVQQHTDVERNNNIQQYTVQQHTDVERNESLDNLPFIGQHEETCSTSFCNQKEEIGGPSYEVVEGMTTNLPPPPPTATGYTVTDEFSTTVCEDGASGSWYDKENVNKITNFHHMENNNPINSSYQSNPMNSPYQSNPINSSYQSNPIRSSYNSQHKMESGDPYSKFDVFPQYSTKLNSTETELFQQEQQQTSVECENKSPTKYLDVIDSEEEEEKFIFQSRNLFQQQHKKENVDKKNPIYPVPPLQQDPIYPVPPLQQDPVYPSSSLQHDLYGTRSRDNQNTSFLNHQIVDDATNDVTTLDYTRHHTIQQDHDDDNKSFQSNRYVIPMTSSSFNGDISSMTSSSYESRHRKLKLNESTTSSSMTSSVMEKTGDDDECWSCETKQKLLITMLDSFTKDNRGSKKKLKKLNEYFQLLSKLQCCDHHSSDIEEDDEGGQSSNKSVNSTNIITMIDEACSPIKFPSYSVSTSTDNDSTSAASSSKVGQQRLLSHKHFTP